MENSLKPERRITMILILILREDALIFPKQVNDEIKDITPYVAHTPLFDSLDRAEKVAHTLLQNGIVKDTDKLSFIEVNKLKDFIN